MPLTRDQARLIDRRAIDELGMSSLVLMENAGRQVADCLCELWPTGPVAICCGTGNNGGDGFVVARHLDIRGREVRVQLWGDPARLTPDAAANCRILDRAESIVARQGATFDPAALATFEGCVVIVDALLGTGSRGEPRPPLDQLIASLNALAMPKLAVDLPSGLDCDTGAPARATIRAALTCTFVAPKAGFESSGAQPYLGKVRVLDIGAPRSLVESVLAMTI